MNAVFIYCDVGHSEEGLAAQLLYRKEFNDAAAGSSNEATIVDVTTSFGRHEMSILHLWKVRPVT